MDGMIVKLKNNKEENYLLPVTSSKAVFMENNDSVEKEFKKYIKKIELDFFIHEKLILKSPNGSLFEVTITDDGQLVTNPYKEPEVTIEYMVLDNGTLDKSILRDDTNLNNEKTYLVLDNSRLNDSILGEKVIRGDRKGIRKT